MSLSANKSRLASSTKELSLKWSETKNYWADARSQEFEQKYIQELQASVDAALGVIDELDKLTAKIRSDCE